MATVFQGDIRTLLVFGRAFCCYCVLCSARLSSCFKKVFLKVPTIKSCTKSCKYDDFVGAQRNAGFFF